jgi:hypothetical protein
VNSTESVQGATGELARQQESFFKAILEGSDCPDVSSDEGLAAYQRAYRLRLYQALEDDFPVSFALLPLEQREKLTEDFFRSAPSTLFTLNGFGGFWVDNLKRKVHELPEGLVELAEFEWELVLALYRDSSAKPAVPPVLLPVDPPLELRLARALRFLRTDWPLAEMYAREELLPRRNCQIVIWRTEGQASYIELADLPFQLLEKLASGKNWDEAVEGLQNDADTAEQMEAALLTLAAECLIEVKSRA